MGERVFSGECFPTEKKKITHAGIVVKSCAGSSLHRVPQLKPKKNKNNKQGATELGVRSSHARVYLLGKFLLT